jgi:hypothetical protein
VGAALYDFLQNIIGDSVSSIFMKSDSKARPPYLDFSAHGIAGGAGWYAGTPAVVDKVG